MTMQYVEIENDNEVSIPDGDYILRDGAAWLTVNGMTVRIKTRGTGIDIRVWEGDMVARDPVYEANVDPHWTDPEEDGPCPLAAWYDTSKELE
jgi:hypothetical protein